MSRPLARRLGLLTAVAASVTAAAVPAFAEPVDVSITATEGTRQFAVQKLDSTPLTAIAFAGPTGSQPFKTVVTDKDRRVVSSGYQVNAQMSNLYLEGAGGALDYATKIASRDISLTYGNALSASGITLPVVPQVSLTGTLGDCSNPDIAAALGITALDGVINTLASLLNTPEYAVCTELAALDATTAVVNSTVAGMTQTLTNLSVPLGDLPFALTGGMQGGPFTYPTYATGTVGAGDTAGAGAATTAGQTPTTKRIMTGTPGITDGLKTLLLNTVNTAIGALPETSLDGTGAKTTLENALAGLSADSDLLGVVSSVSGLPVADQVAFINTLTSAVLPIDLNALSVVSGKYEAFPVLNANSVAAALLCLAAVLLVSSPARAAGTGGIEVTPVPPVVDGKAVTAFRVKVPSEGTVRVPYRISNVEDGTRGARVYAAAVTEDANGSFTLGEPGTSPYVSMPDRRVELNPDEARSEVFEVRAPNGRRPEGEALAAVVVEVRNGSVVQRASTLIYLERGRQVPLPLLLVVLAVVLVLMAGAGVAVLARRRNSAARADGVDGERSVTSTPTGRAGT